MLTDAVANATGTIGQTVGGAFALLCITAIVALWRRDQARNAAELTRIAATHAAELKRIEEAHAREVERLESARSRDGARADAAAAARAELEREVRDRHISTLVKAADALEDTALALRDTRRQP